MAGGLYSLTLSSDGGREQSEGRWGGGVRLKSLRENRGAVVRSPHYEHRLLHGFCLGRGLHYILTTTKFFFFVSAVQVFLCNFGRHYRRRSLKFCFRQASVRYYINTLYMNRCFSRRVALGACNCCRFFRRIGGMLERACRRFPPDVRVRRLFLFGIFVFVFYFFRVLHKIPVL